MAAEVDGRVLTPRERVERNIVVGARSLRFRALATEWRNGQLVQASQKR